MQLGVVVTGGYPLLVILRHNMDRGLTRASCWAFCLFEFLYSTGYPTSVAVDALRDITWLFVVFGIQQLVVETQVPAGYPSMRIGYFVRSSMIANHSPPHSPPGVLFYRPGPGQPRGFGAGGHHCLTFFIGSGLGQRHLPRFCFSCTGFTRPSHTVPNSGCWPMLFLPLEFTVYHGRGYGVRQAQYEDTE